MRRDVPVCLSAGHDGEDLSALADRVVARKRNGDDLILFVNDGEKLILKRYFGENSADSAVLPPVGGHGGAMAPDHGPVGHFHPLAAHSGAPDSDAASGSEGLSPLVYASVLAAGAGLVALIAGAGGGGPHTQDEESTTPKKTARIPHEPGPVHGGDVITGSDQDDKNLEAGQSSVVKAGLGNDIITVTNSGFASIDGGEGLDTAKLALGVNLDARALGRLKNIEAIDFGPGHHRLNLTPELVQGITDERNKLLIDPPGEPPGYNGHFNGFSQVYLWDGFTFWKSSYDYDVQRGGSIFSASAGGQTV
ncbi:MAG: hypothetical protein V6Z86_09110 [Hyphomicrobiales bacterium]